MHMHALPGACCKARGSIKRPPSRYLRTTEYGAPWFELLHVSITNVTSGVLDRHSGWTCTRPAGHAHEHAVAPLLGLCAFIITRRPQISWPVDNDIVRTGHSLFIVENLIYAPCQAQSSRNLSPPLLIALLSRISCISRPSSLQGLCGIGMRASAIVPYLQHPARVESLSGKRLLPRYVPGRRTRGRFPCLQGTADSELQNSSLGCSAVFATGGFFAFDMCCC